VFFCKIRLAFENSVLPVGEACLLLIPAMAAHF
jgi:hypothetical protein